MKTDWEFLTRTMYEPEVFWAMLTAIATLSLVFLAAAPLWDLAKTRRTELARRLREEFWTPRMKAIMFLIDHNLIEYQPGAPSFFSFARVTMDPAQSLIAQTLGDTVVLSSFEIDDYLLNPLEEVALLAFAKSITFDDVYAFFGNFIKSTVENEEIQKHIHNIRTNYRSPNAWSDIEQIVPALNHLDERRLKRLSQKPNP
jgi:hypothetical protein